MSATVIRGDARRLPLPTASVDLIITSPPYYALRSYTDGGEHYDGQIGSEPTPGEYIDNLIACTREWMRVLKPTGSCWVNLGDKYSGGGGQWEGDDRPDPGRRRAIRGVVNTGGRKYGLQPKSLLGLPWRYALRCIDELGLILRAEIIWSKPNGLPESVTDRVRRSHEQWFHFVRQPRYYSGVDHIREEHAGEFLSSGVRNPRYGRPGGQMPSRAAGVPERRGEIINGKEGNNFTAPLNSLGKLPGSVWEIPTEPLQVPEYYIVQGGRTVHYAWTLREAWAWMRSVGVAAGRPSARRMVDHFAAYPTEWPRRIITGWSPSGICTACGEGRRPVAERSLEVLRPADVAGRAQLNGERVHGLDRRAGTHVRSLNAITGEACACPDTTAPTRPAVIVDPFGGTGTTALVAHALGRDGITVDMSADYCRLAAWRTTDPGELAKAMRVDKPVRQQNGQLDLLGFL